jgi:RHS repeat-associated protein
VSSQARRSDVGRCSVAYNLRFPGQYYDQETGLFYNYNRDYDPAVGRYVESDPIGLYGGSYSTYSYAQSDPVVLADPSGLRVDYNGYVVSNPMVRLNFDILNSLIVQSGIDDNCFVLLVTGGDRYRDPKNPQIIRSATNGSIIPNASPRSPHLRERGARAIDFVIRTKRQCNCKPVTDSLVDQTLPWTDFDLDSTERNYPEGPHTHINLPNAPKYYPGGMQ